MQSVQIAASEIWVTLIFGVIMYLFRSELKQKKVTKILMIVCIARLVSDAVSWAFDGVPGMFLGILTRISNYITFVSNDVRRHIVGGTNRALISVETPLRLCRIGTCRRLSAGLPQIVVALFEEQLCCF